MMLKRNEHILIQNVNVAKNFWPRFMGLMGKANLPDSQGVLFPKCNAIHTCFMKFSIDCIFMNEQGEVKKIYRNLRPWRLAGPVWGATQVLELNGGVADKLKIQEGEHLICGH
ncbi:MAG: DUF192 domain-containing protein [Bdellovibrionales bacterium]